MNSALQRLGQILRRAKQPRAAIQNKHNSMSHSNEQFAGTLCTCGCCNPVCAACWIVRQLQLVPCCKILMLTQL